MTPIEQENMRIAKHTLLVIAGYGPETGTTLMQLAAREGLRIIEANEQRASLETRTIVRDMLCSDCRGSGKLYGPDDDNYYVMKGSCETCGGTGLNQRATVTVSGEL